MKKNQILKKTSAVVLFVAMLLTSAPVFAEKDNSQNNKAGEGIQKVVQDKKEKKSDSVNTKDETYKNEKLSYLGINVDENNVDPNTKEVILDFNLPIDDYDTAFINNNRESKYNTDFISVYEGWQLIKPTVKLEGNQIKITFDELKEDTEYTINLKKRFHARGDIEKNLGSEKDIKFTTAKASEEGSLVKDEKLNYVGINVDENNVDPNTKEVILDFNLPIDDYVNAFTNKKGESKYNTDFISVYEGGQLIEPTVKLEEKQIKITFYKLKEDTEYTINLKKRFHARGDIEKNLGSEKDIKFTTAKASGGNSSGIVPGENSLSYKGIEIVGASSNSNVPVDTKTIKLKFDKNVNFDKKTGTGIFENNKKMIELTEKGKSEVLNSIDDVQLKDNVSPEESRIIVLNISKLKHNTDYVITIKSGLVANNENTLGKDEIIEFTTEEAKSSSGSSSGGGGGSHSSNSGNNKTGSGGGNSVTPGQNPVSYKGFEIVGASSNSNVPVDTKSINIIFDKNVNFDKKTGTGILKINKEMIELTEKGKTEVLNTKNDVQLKDKIGEEESKVIVLNISKKLKYNTEYVITVKSGLIANNRRTIGKIITEEFTTEKSSSSSKSGGGGGASKTDKKTDVKKEEKKPEVKEEIKKTEEVKKSEDGSKSETKKVEFKDVKEDSWYAKSVERVAKRGIFKGTGDGKFSPEKNMTRAMFVTALSNMDKKGKDTKKVEFKDVKENSWYAKSVSWAASNKIIAGTGDGKFSPEENISREQIAIMLFRFDKMVGENRKIDKDAMNKFKDNQEVSPWAKEAVSWAISNGIINGAYGKIMPKKDATRAEVAKMIEKYILINK